MALSLNTSHQLYGNLKLLIGVDDDNTLVDLVTPSRVITKHAEASLGSGAYGRHLQTVTGGATVKGATFSPVFTPANNTGTLVVVTNAISGVAAANHYAAIVGPTDSTSTHHLPRLHATAAVANKAAVAGRYSADASGATTSNFVGSAHKMWAVTRNGTTAYAIYVDGVMEVSGTTFTENSTSGVYAVIGGTVAQNSVAAQVVWVAWFDKALTPTEISDLYASLGADNQFALVESGASTPVTFSGSVANQTGTEGTAFSLDLSTYFSGTETPFSYSLQSGTLPAGLSLNTSTGVISGTPTTAGTYSGLQVRATDAGSLTADSNVFTITVAAPGDLTLPTLTGTVTFSSITQTSYTANWPAGADNVAVTGYEYQIGSTAGAWTDAGNNLSAAITGRTAGTTETVYVRAYDASAFRSTPAISGNVTLLSPPQAGITVSQPLKNNTGTVWANQSGIRVAVLQSADLVSVYETAGLTTNGAGMLSNIADTSIIAGQQYNVVIKFADGGVGITGAVTAS